jgi:hypothetical protein
MLAKLSAAALCAVLGAVALPAAAAFDWSQVEQVLGRSSTQQPDGVHRFSFPRTDLNVSVDAIQIEPALALGSWVAFAPMADHVMAMGDLVLTQDEIGPVMERLAAGGISMTALHNHLLRADPATMYLHIEAEGEPVAIATTLRSALEATQTPLVPPQAQAETTPEFDTARLDQLLGHAGKASGRVYQVSIPRNHEITAHGQKLPTALGLSTALNFQATGDGRLAATGDFVLVAEEVEPVLQALTANHIEVTALHNHMLQEEPRLFFMHFWAVADPDSLTKGLRAAVSKMHVEQTATGQPG